MAHEQNAVLNLVIVRHSKGFVIVKKTCMSVKKIVSIIFLSCESPLELCTRPGVAGSHCRCWVSCVKEVCGLSPTAQTVDPSTIVL